VVFGYLVSPARICEAVPEVGEHIVADMQGERGRFAAMGPPESEAALSPCRTAQSNILHAAD
jgi:hypothetical protein